MNKYIKQISDRIYKNFELSELKNKTVLITGANGLIGGFIADFMYYLNTYFDFNIATKSRIAPSEISIG